MPLVYPILFAAAITLLLWMAAPIDQSFKPLAGLGSFSYSIYLLHSVLCQLPTAILQRYMNPYTMFAKAIVMAITVALCYGFYLVAEKPFVSNRRRAQSQNLSVSRDVDHAVRDSCQVVV
jgi:peptidoglycan/LPS O-acetylase OafA/YrhL